MGRLTAGRFCQRGQLWSRTKHTNRQTLAVELSNAARLLAAVAMVVLLSACASKPSLQTSTRCPELPTYTPEFQAALLEDLKTSTWRVRKIIDDWGEHRWKCRVLIPTE